MVSRIQSLPSLAKRVPFADGGCFGVSFYNSCRLKISILETTNIIEHMTVTAIFIFKSFIFLVCVIIPKLFISGGIYLPIFGIIEPDILKAIKIKNAKNVADVTVFVSTLENKTIVNIKIKYRNNKTKYNNTYFIFIKLSSNKNFV